MPKLVVVRPLRKLDLGDQYWFDPRTTFHNCRSEALGPSPAFFLRQVHEQTGRALEFLHAGVEVGQDFF